jgi:gluconolactonase
MKVDEYGNLYSTGPSGIWVFNPDGERLGIIPTPELVGNLAWGGPARDTLYLNATTSLYRLPMAVKGASVPHAR